MNVCILYTHTNTHTFSLSFSLSLSLSLSSELDDARHGEVMFVHEGNLEPSCNIINDALRHYGLPGPIQLPAASPQDACKVANVVYLLLQLRAKGEERGAESAEDAKKLYFDLNVSRNAQAKLKEQLQQRELECTKLVRTSEEASRRAKEERAKLVLERDSALAEKNDLRRRDSQMQHTMRKLEQQCEKLQEKIRSLMSQHDKPLKSQLEMSASIRCKGGSSGGERGAAGAGGASRRWACGSAPPTAVDFTNKVVRAYEEREAALLVENSNIRKALSILSQELMDTINGQHQHSLPLSTSHVLDQHGVSSAGAWMQQLVQILKSLLCSGFT